MTQEVEQRILALARRMEEQEATIKELQAQLKQAQEQAGVAPDEEDTGKVYPNTREGVLQEIMESFNFEKVAEICQNMNWEIYGEEDGVTVEFLKRDAEEKIQEAWNAFDCGDAKEEWIIHSGPLKLWWCECDDGIFAELSFVAEEWRVEPLEH